MICLSHVSVSFDDGRGSFDAVGDFTYDFPARGLFFVTGESGAGKSTLLNAIGGLQKITSGEITRSEGVSFSYVFQDEGLLFSLSLLDNLRLAERDEAKIVDSLEYVGLKNKLREPISLLSKGERARLSIARALLSRSSVILLDEPTGNLDSANAAKVYGLLSSVSREKLVVVVSHDGAAAKNYGDAVLRMKDGKLAGADALKPLPQGGPAASGAQDPRIPWAIRWRYAGRKIFGGRAKLVFSSLSLLLAGTLLLLSLNFAFYDGDASAREAAATSAPLFFATCWNPGDGTSVYSGKAYSEHLGSVGIDATYEIPTTFYSSEYPTNVRLILSDSIVVNGISYSPAGGEAVVSDCLCTALGADVGSDLGGFYSTEFKGLGITIGQKAATGYGALRSRFPNTSSGDESYSTLLLDSYYFIAINAETNARLLERWGLPMWNFSLGSLESQFRTTVCDLYSEADGSPTLLYGRYPSSADEVMLGEAGAKAAGGGNESAAVGKELTVYPFTHDYYQMSQHFSSLKVCGILGGSGDDCFYASEAFFEELKGEAKYEEPIIFGKDALLAYVDAGRPNDIIVASAPVADPLKSAAEIASAMAGLRTAFLIVGGILGALSLTLLSLYSLDAMRRGEKDIAILKSLGKGGFAIASMFLFMDIIIVTGALILSLVAGFFVTRWVGGIIESTMFLSFDPIPNSPWSFLIVAAAAYALPVAASLFAGRAVYRTDVAAVFKRNLS
jgi:ABC-type lipoprotein export system ATPase subunit